ncbi:hypothetical protein C6503_25505 [Candidatus Poribacteria bacterium]|nr:MAG: hypothetical protein C6503_25505 [Candidatus Poribacteria bacterium]
MTELRTWHEILIADLAANRAEAIDYLDLSLQEYQIDGDTSFFLKGIRNIIEALGGVTEIAKQTDTEPEVLFEVLSSDKVPCIDTLNIIANALGCRLSIEPIAAISPSLEVKDTDHPSAQRETTRERLSVATDS